MKQKNELVGFIQRCLWVSFVFLVAFLGYEIGLFGNHEPRKYNDTATYRYVLVPSEVADVLFDASNGTCKDCPAVKDIACHIARGSRACPWSCMMDVLDAAIVRVDDASCAVLTAYRNELERQAAADEVMTVPVTAKRSFVCNPRTGCSGVLPPDFSGAIAALNTIRLNVCTAPCASGLFNIDCSDLPCLVALQNCLVLASGCFSGCLELRDFLSGACAGLVPATGGSCPICPTAMAPQPPVPPVLPTIPGGSKTLICDLRLSTIEGNTGLFGQLGVEEDLSVAGSGTFGGNLDVGGSVRIGGSLDVGTGIVGGGSLQIAGDGLFNGDVCISGQLILNSGLLCMSGSGNNLVVQGLKADFACIDDASIDRVTSELGCVDLLCVGQLGAEQGCFNSLVALTGCIGELGLAQSRTTSACIGTLRVANVVGADACLDNARVNTLNAHTACLGNAYADSVGASTGIIDNLDVCTELVSELFVSDLAKYNGALSGLCWPQGFGEILFTAKDFCLPLPLDEQPSGSSGCMYTNGAFVYWPYSFDDCGRSELVCGAPIPRCEGGESFYTGFMPHVDFVVPSDYEPHSTFELDVYVFFPSNNPSGLYAITVPVGGLTSAIPCDFFPLPFRQERLFGSCSVGQGMGVAKFTVSDDFFSLFPGAWTRFSFFLGVAPIGSSNPCPPLISSMVLRYSRVDINEAAAIFPG